MARRFGDNSKVEFSGHHPVRQGATEGLNNPDIHIGQGVYEGGEHFGQRALGYGRYQTDIKRAGHPGRKFAHVLRGALDVTKNAAAILVKTLAGGRRAHPARVAFEQHHTDRIFQVLDLQTEARLRHPQPVGGAVDTAILIDRHKCANLL